MVRETGVARSHKTHRCLTCRAESGEAGIAVSKDNHRGPTRLCCGLGLSLTVLVHSGSYTKAQ